MYDPIELARRLEEIVARGDERKYYRFRAARFYGGIATADCVGCCLRCAFCWSRAPLTNPERVGRFYNPAQVFAKLNAIAKKHGYSQLRISGNEPTIGRQHLLCLLGLVEQTNYSFILETNGILLGADPSYAQALGKFENLHVRVSLKGCDAEQFSHLTGAKLEAFELQLTALRNLLDAGVSCHAAIMQEFAPKDKLEQLTQQLSAIDRSLVQELEFEYLIPFPHVIQELARRGIHVEYTDIKTSIRKNY
ncbi:MAG: radical SAM protein [Hadesarchaea archaeon]|nr:radical SAM protein [Hadesarchaea archaeon]